MEGTGVSGTHLDAAIQRRAEINLQEVGREAILHDQRLGKAHVINGSAARIWELCDGRDLDSLVIAFATLYNRSPDDVRQDVQRVLGSFRSLDLLE
jgi:hypothetical protein